MSFVKDVCPFHSTIAFDWDGGVTVFPDEEMFCGRGNEIVLQAFNWESWKSGSFYHQVASNAESYARYGRGSLRWLREPREEKNNRKETTDRQTERERERGRERASERASVSCLFLLVLLLRAGRGLHTSGFHPRRSL